MYLIYFAQVNDTASIMALQTMSFALMAAASFNRVPNIWGGVFGQELTVWKNDAELDIEEVGFIAFVLLDFSCFMYLYRLNLNQRTKMELI